VYGWLAGAAIRGKRRPPAPILGGAMSGRDQVGEAATPRHEWDPERYGRSGRFVSDLGSAVLELLRPRPGERILDLGCGDGALTARIREAGAQVVGVDASAEMVAAARARGLDARVADGEALEFHREFDAVFSNAALHWMRRPDRVIEGVAEALRPGGRFVAELGGHGNVAAIHLALAVVLERRGVDPRLVEPPHFPSVAAYRHRLEAHGFEVYSIELVPRPTILPGGMDDWVRTFGHPWLALCPERDHDAVATEAAELLSPFLRDESGAWTADYVRLRFAARLR
jgi:SAM-dependent methyltransferase